MSVPRYRARPVQELLDAQDAPTVRPEELGPVGGILDEDWDGVTGLERWEFDDSGCREE
jgi:hypothetical protein